MMPKLTMTALAAAVPLAVLAGIYLFSADQTRRNRAWRLLRLLFRR
jgi:ABC-type phosphate transport system permease subunit